MLDQLVIGVGLTLVSIIIIAGTGLWVAEAAFTRRRAWLRAPPHPAKVVAVAGYAGILVLGVMLSGVFVWAGAFAWLGMFGDFETAFYFALVSYTTVGYGDVVPFGERRILGAMAAANGFINIGLLTTVVLRGLQHVREGYRRTLDGERDEGD